MWNPKRVKEIILEQGRTRKWLAAQCGVSKEHLDQCLGNHRRPGLPVLLHMARALNVSVTQLDSEAQDVIRAVG